MRIRHCFLAAFLLFLLAMNGAVTCLNGQSVQPVIAEYTGSADGFFEVTNGGVTPQIVLLEPKSFSVNEDGGGVFRPLDANIQLDLSATSVRLEPLQTARIFYKVRAASKPAWLCIYAVFTPLKKTQGINVRIMLPHTIYVYQKESLPQSAILVSNVHYDSSNHRVTCDLQNQSSYAARAAQVEVTGQHTSATQGGFPVLPQLKRKLSIEWTANQPPQTLLIHFPTYDLKLPVASTTN